MYLQYGKRVLFNPESMMVRHKMDHFWTTSSCSASDDASSLLSDLMVAICCALAKALAVTLQSFYRVVFPYRYSAVKAGTANSFPVLQQLYLFIDSAPTNKCANQFDGAI